MSDFNHDYWKELDTLEKFYYLGMLMGDGSVAAKSNVVAIRLSVEDIHWMQNYKKNTGIDTKLNIVDLRPTINSVQCGVVKCSPEWKKDLARYGVIPRKVGLKRLPLEQCTCDQEVSALLLGFHDADFSICRSRTTGKYRATMYGPKPLCEQVNRIFSGHLGIKPNSIRPHPTSDTLHQVAYSKPADLKRIRDFLYMNENLERCWLSRKHDKWHAVV